MRADVLGEAEGIEEWYAYDFAGQVQREVRRCDVSFSCATVTAGLCSCESVERDRKVGADGNKKVAWRDCFLFAGQAS